MLKHPIPALRPNCLLNSLNMFQFFLCLGPLFDSPLRWSRFVENDISEESSDRGHTCRGQDGQGWLDDEAGSLVRRIAMNVRSLTVASCNTCNMFFTNYGWFSLICSISRQKTISNHILSMHSEHVWAVSALGGGSVWPCWERDSWGRMLLACTHGRFAVLTGNTRFRLIQDTVLTVAEIMELHGITVLENMYICQSYASVLVSKIIEEYQRSTICGFVNGTPNQFGGLSLFRHQSPMVDHHFPIFLPLKLPSILLDRPLPRGFRAARPRQMTPMRTGEGNDKKIQWK